MRDGGGDFICNATKRILNTFGFLILDSRNAISTSYNFNFYRSSSGSSNKLGSLMECARLT